MTTEHVILLPPKKYELPSNEMDSQMCGCYWFAKIILHRQRLPITALKIAHERIKAGTDVPTGKIAQELGLSYKTLVEYIEFEGRKSVVVLLNSGAQDAVFKALNYAYFLYARDAYSRPWDECLYEAHDSSYRKDPATSLMKRGISRLEFKRIWELDPFLYPEQYKGPRLSITNS